MKPSRRTALFLILCSCGLSVLWGSFIAHSSAGGLTDFKAVFYGSRCLIHHTDPYRSTDFIAAYLGDGQQIPTEPRMADLFRRAVFVCVNLPTTLFFVPIIYTLLRKKAPVDMDRQIAQEAGEVPKP